MHALEYDPIHDELCVNSPLNNAILTFRGGAKGEDAPIRVIQGPHTLIQSTGYDGNDKMDHCAHIGLVKDVMKSFVKPRWKSPKGFGAKKK